MVKTSIERKTAKPTAGRAAPASRSTSQPRPSSPHPHPRSSGRGPRNWAKTEPIGKPSPRKTLCVRRSCVSSEARSHLCSLREARSPGPSGDRAGAPTTLQFRRDPSPPRGEDQRGDGTCQPGRPCHVRSGTALPAGFQGLTRQLAHRQVKTSWALPCNQRPADAHAPKRSALNQRCLSSRLRVKKGGREGMGQHDRESLLYPGPSRLWRSVLRKEQN